MTMSAADESSTKKKNICKIAVLVMLFLMSLAFIISYVLFESTLNENLETATEVGIYLFR